MHIEGKILISNFHFNRLKQTYLRITTGSVTTLADLKQIINLGIGINDKKQNCMNVV